MQLPWRVLVAQKCFFSSQQHIHTKGLKHALQQRNLASSVATKSEGQECIGCSLKQCGQNVHIHIHIHIHYYSSASCDLHTRTTVPCSTMQKD